MVALTLPVNRFLRMFAPFERLPGRLGTVSVVEGWEFVNGHNRNSFRPILLEVKTFCNTSFLIKSSEMGENLGLLWTSILPLNAPLPVRGVAALTTDGNEVGNNLRDITSSHPLVHLGEAQSGMGLINVEA